MIGEFERLIRRKEMRSQILAVTRLLASSLRSGFRRAAQFLACPEQLSETKLSNGPRKRLNFCNLTSNL